MGSKDKVSPDSEAQGRLPGSSRRLLQLSSESAGSVPS